MMNNPLLQPWITPLGTPPFIDIRAEHFRPAIDEAIKSASDEIRAITENNNPPDFANTIEALECTGERLGEISLILFNLNSAETSKEIQSVALEVSPLLTRFSNDITLNKKLFERIKAVYNSKGKLPLSVEQVMLLERKYRSFILG